MSWKYFAVSARLSGASIPRNVAGSWPTSIRLSSRAATMASRTFPSAAPTSAAVNPGTAFAAGSTMPASPFAKDWAGVPWNGPAGAGGVVALRIGVPE